MTSKKQGAARRFWLSIPAIGRIGLAAVLGLACAYPALVYGSWLYAALVLWDVTAAAAITALWISVRSMSASETKSHASSEDPGRGLVDTIMLTAGLASLVAVSTLIVKAQNADGIIRSIDLGLGVASVVISWLAIHVIFMLRYADLYFKQDGSIDFNSKEAPTYQDFAYLAFTIGMTYQVSDTDLISAEQRRLARQHALWSYLFGTAIIAATINAIAGLGK